MRLTIGVLVMFAASVAAQDTRTAAPAAAPKKVVVRDKTSAVFPHPQPAVWRALVEALADADLHPETLDVSGCVAFLKPDNAWGTTWGEANELVNRISTKRVTTWSTWQSLAASGSILCKKVDESSTEVRVQLRLAGCNGWRAYGSNRSCAWETLQSNGYLEATVLAGVEKRLGEPPIPDAPAAEPPRVNAKAVDELKAALLQCQKVDAAFQLAAPDDLLLARLVDALAALDSVPTDSDSLRPITRRLRDGLEAFQRARSDKAIMDESLSAARAAISDARQALKRYEEAGEPQKRKPVVGDRPTGPIVR